MTGNKRASSSTIETESEFEISNGVQPHKRVKWNKQVNGDAEADTRVALENSEGEAAAELIESSSEDEQMKVCSSERNWTRIH
jgi:hypothetical protein